MRGRSRGPGTVGSACALAGGGADRRLQRRVGLHVRLAVGVVLLDHLAAGVTGVGVVGVRCLPPNTAKEPRTLSTASLAGSAVCQVGRAARVAVPRRSVIKDDSIRLPRSLVTQPFTCRDAGGASCQATGTCSPCVCLTKQRAQTRAGRGLTTRAATRTLPPPPQERVPVRSMHARPCVLHGPATGASTSASVPLSAPAAGRPGARLSRFRTSAHAGRSVTAATHSSPAAHDDAAPAVPRRLVLATPPALALLLATALQPGSAAAAARRLKAPPVAEFLTLPVSAVPRLAGGYVLRLWSASLTQRRR